MRPSNKYTNVDWFLNGTSTHRKVNLSKLWGRETDSVGKRLPTRYNTYYLVLHDNNATQFTVKHSSYINTTTGYLIK